MHWNEPGRNAGLAGRYVGIWQCAVALVAAGLIAVLAFGQLFTTFVRWDDEGYFLQAYRDFLSGRVLYDQIFAFYGPLTFFSSALLARFDIANVTHDTFRWILLPVWIAIAALMAGVVWRWTRRFAPSVATFLLIGFHLKGLAKGVGHPQVWIILATAVLLWLGLDWGSQAGKERYAFRTGAVLGAIVLLKINIGIFVSFAFFLAVSLQMKVRPRVLAGGLLSIAAGAAGMALLLATPITSEKCFVLAYLASLAATIGIAIGRAEEQPPSPASLIWLAAGLAACVCLGMGGTLASGSTLRAIYGAYVTAPAQFARSFHNPFFDATRKGSILISTMGLVAALGVFRWRPPAETRGAWIGLLKVAAGAGLMCAFSYHLRQTLTGSLLFLWLLIADVPPMSGPAYANRLFLAVLCPFFSLQLFPMAGEQVDWAALMPMVASAVLLGDGMNCVAREKCRAAFPRLTGFATAAIGTLLTIFLFALVGRNAVGGVRRWRNSQPLNLPGTHWLRLPPGETARLTTTVRALRQNCQTVLLIPGLYSFSLWSGVPPAEERRINNWPLLWPEDVRKNELRKLGHQSQGCVLVSEDVYDFFKEMAVSPGKDELLPEIRRTMRPIFTGEGVTLYRFLP